MTDTDLLASLPAHLLDDILKRLALRDAVRTSALSRAWRRRWESVPGLSLSFPDGAPPSVISGVLFLYTAPRISHFAACEINEQSASHLDHWLITLSRRSVQSICIDLDQDLWYSDRGLLHSSIFSCTRLVSLDLRWCAIPSLSTGFSGFPVLEKLCLDAVRFLEHGERQLQAIVRGSPLLRVLKLEHVENPVDCVIDAPNVRRLIYCSEFVNIDSGRFRERFGELPCLQDAAISAPLASTPDCLSLLLAVVARVRLLTFCWLEERFKIDSIPFTFYNLRTLELWIHFSTINPIISLFSLLRSSPNLEKLKVQLQNPGMVADWEFLNAQWTDGMCANLQIVEIISNPVHGWLPISLMKLILSKASLLRTMSVDICLGSQDDQLNELLTCRRVSAQAQVLFETASQARRQAQAYVLLLLC
ncbi:hypothetical protein U9M48_037783 [Paspalum notatum var. saurae]|uniref:F-box domain-containing protein n=1 Tax=Paspalum notatum var. saurae TaxID=547442 RepID=A0AAQ3UH64_PASNO